MDQNIEVKVTAGPGTQTILLGDAQAPLPNPKRVEIKGNIDAPARFYEKRRSEIEIKTAHVLVHREDPMYIGLFMDETNPINKEVIGELKFDLDLVQFQINANRLYTVKELANLLRLRRQFFRDTEQHAKTMKSLGEFSARTSIEFKEIDDRKGNTEILRKRASTVDLDFEFVLNIPIYKGFEPKTFRIEILADVTDGGVKLWLESIELAELVKTERDAIFAEQIKALDGFVIIEQ